MNVVGWIVLVVGVLLLLTGIIIASGLGRRLLTATGIDQSSQSDIISVEQAGMCNPIVGDDYFTTLDECRSDPRGWQAFCLQPNGPCTDPNQDTIQ
jgi:hypothetical protein